MLKIHKKKFFRCLLFAIAHSTTGYFVLYSKNYTHDLIIVGEMRKAEGLGKVGWTLYDALQNKLNILMLNEHELPNKKMKYNAKIVLCTSQRGMTLDPNLCRNLPRGTINIAYSVCETDRCPQHWVDRFNKYFDAVIVPDPFLVKVYQNSGVTTPIFMLPHGFYLERFMKQPIKQTFQNPFIFGMSGAFYQGRKNAELLVKSFVQAFGNSPSVQLKIHTKGPWNYFCDSLANLIQQIQVTNINFEMKLFSDEEYIDFLRSLDCYVLVSSGEGYSITPREALALGIPCILSDTTAHTTICQNGYVKAVPSAVTKPVFHHEDQIMVPIGNQYSPSEADVSEALMEVYTNKEHYLALAQQARPWLEQYTDEKLMPCFSTLCNPKRVILGNKNEITEEYLMTKSDKLYKKYLRIKK